MSVNIGGSIINLTFADTTVVYSEPVNISQRSEGWLDGVASTANVVVNYQVSTGNELGPWADAGGSTVTFVKDVANRISTGIKTWVRFKFAPAGAGSFSGRFISNPTAL